MQSLQIAKSAAWIGVSGARSVSRLGRDAPLRRAGNCLGDLTGELQGTSALEDRHRESNEPAAAVHHFNSLLRRTNDGRHSEKEQRKTE